MAFKSSSETLTPNSSSTLNMNSMKLSESMPSESSGAAGSRPSAVSENSLAASSLMRASVSIAADYILNALIICGLSATQVVCMSLYALGLNHQTAPLAVRERVVFHVERLRDALIELKRGRAREAAILSTCNRTELYVAGEEPAALAQWFAQYHHLQAEGLEPYLYTLPSEQAVRHAFRVASGLDSMVLGEPQILGQMKQAERLARQAGGLGLLLNHLFQRTFAVAKEVRSSTDIGIHSVSMAAAAVRMCERIFGQLDHSHLLFVGAGEMIELAATHFAAQGPARIAVANRTLQRAERLAHRFNGEAIELQPLPARLLA